MVRKALLPLSLAGMLAALTACGGPAVHFTDFDPSYTHGEVLYATRDGPLPVEAFGRVMIEKSLQGETLERTVARALSRFGPHWFAAGFTADKGEDPDPYYRVRWLFNTPVNFPPFSACANGLAAQAGAWAEETGLVVAAFCRGKRLLSMARGSYGPPGGGGPAAFSRFIGTMGQVLMPSINPDQRDDDCRRPLVCP